MSFSERVQVIIDVVTDKATTGIRDFKTSVSEAEGFTGKLKAGVGSLGDQFKTAAANPAIMGTAIAAVGGAAFKAVDEFADLGLQVGKFRDATGLSAEESSRWIEVAGDMGISSDTLGTAIGRMERTLGTNAEAFAKFGVEVVRAKDGTVDANATFLNAVDALSRIEDPVKRAEAGAKIFGKGWQEMAELVSTGAGDLQSALDAVDTSKLIDDDNIDQARKWRDTLDNLSDIMQGAMLDAGRALIPVLTDMAETLGQVGKAGQWLMDHDPLAWATDGKVSTIQALTGALNPLAQAQTIYGEAALSGAKSIDLETMSLQELNKFLAENKFSTEDATEITEKWRAKHGDATGAVGATQAAAVSLMLATHDLTAATDDSAGSLDAMKRATENAKKAAEDLDKAWSDLKGEVDDDQAFLDLQTTFDDVRKAGEDAWIKSAEAADAAREAANKYGAESPEAMEAARNAAQINEQAIRDAASATNDLKNRVIDYGQQVLGLPPERVTKMIAEIDKGNLAAVEAQLKTLERNRTANLFIVQHGGAGYGPTYGGPRAAGGPTQAGRWYDVAEGGRSELLHENGRTMLIAGANGEVEPLSSVSGTAGGATFNVTINATPGANGYEMGRQFVEAVKRYEKIAGPQFTNPN